MVEANFVTGSVDVSVSEEFFAGVLERLDAETASGSRFAAEPVSPPTVAELCEITRCAFMTSLRPEEGRRADLRLVFGGSAGVARYHPARRFDAKSLAKIAPILLHEETYLVVARDAGGLAVIGQTASSTHDELKVETRGPGVVVFRCNDEVLGVLDRERAYLPKGNHFGIRSLLRRALETQDMAHAFLLASVAKRMVTMGRGGTLLIVRGEPKHGSLSAATSFADPWVRFTKARDHWRDSVRLRHTAAMDHDLHSVHVELEHALDDLAGLTGIDGAVLADYELSVRSFSSKIRSRVPEAMVDSCNVLTGERTEAAVNEFHGTRHQSALAFCHDNPDAIALVVSQDGGTCLLGVARDSGKLCAFTRLEILL